MKTVIFFFVVVIMFFAPLQTFAWGALGHRVTGKIAESYLNPKAKSALKQLLGNESLAMASSWADFIRSDTSYSYLSTWHYINIRGGKNLTDFMQYLREDTATDLYTKINFIVKELKSKKLPKSKQILYVKLLIHFVGDIHQPLHTGHPEDRGGNDIKVYWFGQPTNLHRVWDEHMVEFQQLSYTEHAQAINFTTAAQRQKWMRQPLSEWLYESYESAQKLYAEVKPEDKLRYDYNYYHVELMNQQLLKAGVRLAGLLNDIFGK